MTWFLVVGAASLLSMKLRVQLPITPHPSLVDDALYTRAAGYLAQGKWLGPFDQYTMLKMPAYPIFIALLFRSGLPLQFGEQLTYLFAAAAVSACIWLVLKRPVVVVASYVVLALDPVNFNIYGARVVRDSWYASLSMLLVAAFFLLISALAFRMRLRWLIPIAVSAGIAAATFWLCREEGFWILPTLGVIAVGFAGCLLGRWFLAKPRALLDRTRTTKGLLRVALVLAIVGAIVIMPILALTAANSRHYGAGLTNDLVSGEYARSYAEWRRVEAGQLDISAPISKAQREAVYQISANAMELQPYVDPIGRCRKPCGENVWRAIRDAAALAGHFDSESDAQTFFGGLDSQINAACASGQLSCRGRLPTQLQSLQFFSAGPLIAYVRNWGAATLMSTGFDDSQKGVRWLGPRAPLFNQVVRGTPTSSRDAHNQHAQFLARIWEYNGLSRIYHILLPGLLLVAAVGFLWAIVRPRWPRSSLSILSVALLVGVLSRLVLVGLLSTTQFVTEGSDVRYLLPAHALLIAFAVVGSAQFADALAETRSRRVSPAEQPAAAAEVSEDVTAEPAAEPLTSSVSGKPEPFLRPWSWPRCRLSSLVNRHVRPNE